MVAADLKAELHKSRIDLVHFLARRPVDNAALVIVRRQVRNEKIRFPRRLDDTKIQIGPVKTADKNLRPPQTEEVQHIFLDALRRRGRKGARYGPHGQGVDPRADFLIARTKIMTPLRDAVRLVDDDRRHGNCRHKGRKKFILQPLRRHIEKLNPTLPQLAKALLHLLQGTLAVNKGRRNLLRPQRIDLVLHER